ncbi:MAG: efflux RND transporter permease subunit [bacterium]
MTTGVRSYGVAGRIAQAFLHSRLTPLTILVSILLGLLALAILPREEEPQIQVPMVDIQLAWPGMPVLQVERQLTSPVERILWQIPDLEYLYSTSREDGALLIARFKVGESPERALTRVRTRLDEAAASALPHGASIASVASRSIDDVPILGITLWNPARADADASDLRRVAAELAIELRKTPGVSRVRILGGEPREVLVQPDPARMTAAGISIDQLIGVLTRAGLAFPARNTEIGGVVHTLRAESSFESADAIRALAIPSPGGRTVRLSEIATVEDGPRQPTAHVFFGEKSGARHPAVTVEVAKRPGENATAIAHTLLERVDELRPTLLGDEIRATVTRNYGETARHKSDDLIFHLLLATLSVVALIAFALGRREALVVAIAIPVTLALTLFLYSFLGYTLNRVTLFALIFSIGILVDDAIVVVENIARHYRMKDSRDTDRRVVEAVDEVGNPTVLATVAVIASILPLAFVGGLMGPYMKPIPIGASLAMLFSLAVAFMVTPWAARRLVRADAAAHHDAKEGALDRLYRRLMGRLLASARARVAFFSVVVALFAGAAAFVAFGIVAVKMLPFDNKSEFEVILDMPPGTALEKTLAAAADVSAALVTRPEVVNTQTYAGLGAPVTFNGLVRHYDFRAEPRFAEVQVNLVHANERRLQSHAIAREVRPEMEAIAARYGARVKVVEVPPGPPVLSTLVAEIYGPDLEEIRNLGHQVWDVFRATPGVVDTDLLLAENEPRRSFVVDRDRAALAGVSPGSVGSAFAALYGGQTVGVLRAPDEAEAVPVAVRLAPADRADLSALAAIRVGAAAGASGPGGAGAAGVPLSELGSVVAETSEPEIYHKNLRRVVYVLGDVAGKQESPVYAIAALRPRIDALTAPDGKPIHQMSTRLPDSDEGYSLKWDGEWHITYEVFRDMGAAFAVVLVLIYVLTVGWFKSFTTPLVIMLPIPLTLIGILPAHAIMGAFFTATSMIGFIVGAGITVRNSIILVDFIELRLAQGLPLREAVIDAGAVRFRPMVLTAAAVVVGGTVILFDPIFQGLAVSLIGGEIAATILSRSAVPVLYYMFHARARARGAAHAGAPGVQSVPTLSPSTVNP